MLNWPVAQQQGSPNNIAIVRGTQATLWFDWIGTQFIGRYGTKCTLTHDSAGQVYVLTFPDGSVNEFQDFTVASTLQGAFIRQLSPTGNVTEVAAYTASGSIAQINQLGSQDGQPVINAFLYAYSDEHRVTSVTLRRQRGLFGWEDILRAVYEYYEAGDDFGNDGDLKRMQKQFPIANGWATGENKYYRYYQEGDLNGFAHGLRYVVEPATYEKMLTSGYDPLTTSNATIAMFADNYFEYDTQQRAILEQVDGASQTFTFEYTDGTSSTDKNVWATKTIETLPDGSQNIVYSSVLGLPLIRDFTSGTGHWINAFHYDDHGRLLWHASPSAVLGYDDSHPDLAIDLRSHDGLISVTDYYTTSGSGAAEGYVAARKIQQGASGDPVTLATLEYMAQTVGSTKFYFVASQTLYRNDNSTGDIETSYAYTFYPDTAQIQQQTTTLPVVPTDQNGSGIAATRKTYFDTWSQPIWLMDERGIITRQTFDVPTGTLIQRVDDVDTSVVLGAPSGWETIPGAGMNLTTDYLVDGLGRTIRSLGPMHQIDLNGIATTIRQAKWTIFDDVQHQWATGLGYQVVDSVALYSELVNPVSLAILDAGGKLLQDVRAASTSTAGSLANIVANGGGITATFPQDAYVGWTTYHYTDCCLLESQRVYHTIPATGEGSAGINYDQTDYGYDVMKRRNHVETPGGTITDLVYDPRGLLITTYAGTNDDGATESDPTGGGTDPGNNMVLITANEYDNGVDGGDGNLTEQTQAVDATVNRVTSMTYDFRNRRITTDGEIDYFEKRHFDNVDRLVMTERYDTSDAGNLIARWSVNFNNRGDVYQTIRYGVDPTTGVVGNSLVDNTWFDAAGNVIKFLAAGSCLFTKNAIDSLGRTTIRYSGYDLSESSYLDALELSDDVILEQTETLYDDANNVIQVTSRLRYHNAPASQTGPLRDPTATPKARVTYCAMWQDGTGRTVAAADYGTNGGTALVRPDTIPVSSDLVLLSLMRFDRAGDLLETVNPAGIVIRSGHDNRGRIVTQVDNYQPDAGSSSSSSSSNSPDGNCPSSDDTNRVTRYAYTADGQRSTMTVENSHTGDQTTTWTYGTTLANCDVASSLLLRSVTYPDSEGDDDVVSFSYNRQQQQTLLADQRGCVHRYDYDRLGRRIHDRVITIGAGVDDAILRISTTYEVRGMIQTLASWNNADIASGTIVNECLFEYNNFKQLINEYQENSGAVGDSTPGVAYGYADGSSNTIRPTSLTYPNGRSIAYAYGDSGSIADAISRISTLRDGDVDLVEYSYLGGPTSLPAVTGLGRTRARCVIATYLEPNVEWSMVDLSGSDDSDTGDIYAGFDRFGRIKDNRWSNNSTDTDVDRIKYGYDRLGNRTYRENVVATSNDTHWDELYLRDVLDRVKSMERGQLTTLKNSITDQTFAECWQLDSTGNWVGFRRDDSGDGSWDLVQDRSFNTVNEIVDIRESTGAAWAIPEYDPAGNITTMPSAADPTAARTCVYDAWNRLTSVHQGSDVISAYSYDAAKRRIVQKHFVSGSLSETRHFYYTEPSRWQVIEERVDSSTDAERQLLWGLRYIDDCILRERSTLVEGTFDERLYVCQDANWNTDAVLDSAGGVLERYAYSAYGVPTILAPNFDPRSISSHNWEILYGGYLFEDDTGVFHVRNRFYVTILGTWGQRDPMGFAVGPNLYQYMDSSPLDGTDPAGLEPPTPPKFPTDPSTPPGPDWKWSGKQPAGGPNGAWVGPNGESIHWDTSPHDDIGPHWDWNDQYGNKWKFDPATNKWYPDKGNNPNKPQPVFPPGTLQTVTKVVVVGVGIYIVYRCVRVIPSLFPPLWPTLVPNLAIP